MENRYKGDTGNNCLLSVDGADFLIPFHGEMFYSHKYNKSGLRYELAVCIKSGDLCWLNGPFAAGANDDLSIFRSGLMTELEEFECCKADDRYKGESPRHINCPSSLFNDPEREPNTNPSNPLSWALKPPLMGGHPTRAGLRGADFSLG